MDHDVARDIKKKTEDTTHAEKELKSFQKLLADKGIKNI
jgi:hypothetical protein